MVADASILMNQLDAIQGENGISSSRTGTANNGAIGFADEGFMDLSDGNSSWFGDTVHSWESNNNNNNQDGDGEEEEIDEQNVPGVVLIPSKPGSAQSGARRATGRVE